jgi:hypothetical protein
MAIPQQMIRNGARIFYALDVNIHFCRVQFDFLSEAPEARQRVAHGISRGVEDPKPTKPRQGRQIHLFSAAPVGARISF